MLWSQLAAEIDAFQIHLVTTTYGDGAMVEVKSECWTVVLTMVHVIWGYLRKVRVESETAYVYDILLVMVGQYL